MRNARVTSKTDHLPADNNITRTIKGRDCVLRKTRVIKVCSARTGADIPGRRYATLRYSRTKSLPNPPCVRVPASIRIYVYRYVRIKRKYVGNSDVERMRKICVPGIQRIIIKILFLSDNLFFRSKMNFDSLGTERKRVLDIYDTAYFFLFPYIYIHIYVYMYVYIICSLSCTKFELADSSRELIKLSE